MIILGGYYGGGRNGGNIAQFLLAVRSESGEKFFSFCRVSNGFNDSELTDIVKKCGKALPHQPHNVEVGREKADVWYDPKITPVLQVKKLYANPD